MWNSFKFQIPSFAVAKAISLDRHSVRQLKLTAIDNLAIQLGILKKNRALHNRKALFFI
jgi:hypothetical protein